MGDHLAKSGFSKGEAQILTRLDIRSQGPPRELCARPVLSRECLHKFASFWLLLGDVLSAVSFNSGDYAGKKNKPVSGTQLSSIFVYYSGNENDLFFEADGPTQTKVRL